MLDLSKVPVDKIKELLAMLTKAKPFNWVTGAKAILALLVWATDQLNGQDPAPSPIGASGDEDKEDIAAIEALAAGNVVSDEAMGGGVLLSLAISALIRQALKLLASNI